MSFDIYVQCFSNGEPLDIPLAPIRGLFPVKSEDVETEGFVWHVRYDRKNSCDLSFVRGGVDGVIDGFVVHRPCGDLKLWDGLFAVLKMGNVVAYWPGGKQPVAFNSRVAKHMPPGMLESLGSPREIRSGEEFRSLIEESP